ncbi:MAG: DUF222 domain-containing protein [Candidatus Dormibacteraeota bacterium]|nr:DUF222 domain-containing protein [Candidatus Dormibacteraeota bacterium]
MIRAGWPWCPVEHGFARCRAPRRGPDHDRKGHRRHPPLRARRARRGGADRGPAACLPGGEPAGGGSHRPGRRAGPHLTENAAHGQVRLARQLTGLPHAAAAFQRGEISCQHVVQIVRAVEQVERWGSGDCADSAEVLLIEQARNCDPYELSNWERTSATGWPPRTWPPKRASGAGGATSPCGGAGTGRWPGGSARTPG